MKIGLIARFDNSGLGNLSWEFARHLNPDKVLLTENFVNQTFPERFAQYPYAQLGPSQDNRKVIDWFLEDLDVVVTCETFYDWTIVKAARKIGVKTVLYTMCEMTEDPMRDYPDLFICPSKLDYDIFKPIASQMKKKIVYLPVAVATDRLIHKQRQVAHTFIHTASHGGISGRKGTQLFLDAIPYVKGDVKFILYTWKDVYNVPSDPRLEVRKVNYKNYWQLWREGDVLVYPQGANGICLPIIEAMASGMAVITTDIYPFNEYMPEELLIPVEHYKKVRMQKNLVEVSDPVISVSDLIAVMNKWANKDITKQSAYGRTWAEENSWVKLASQLKETLQNV